MKSTMSSYFGVFRGTQTFEGKAVALRFARSPLVIFLSLQLTPTVLK